MTELQERLLEVQQDLTEGVHLVAVSKFHPLEALLEAYDAGQRIFGESRVQELQEKQPRMPKDVEWHFIGHLQQNKVKYIAPYISLIHAVDSLRLLTEINRQAERCAANREANGLQPSIRVLLQLHVAQEETKFGFTPRECKAFLDSGEWRNLKYVEIAGVMCMASNTDDEAQIADEFQTAEDFFHMARERYFANSDTFCECSWGMSDDYQIAMQHGSTLVRVGSRIFGARNYTPKPTNEAQKAYDEAEKARTEAQKAYEEGLEHAQRSEWGEAASCFRLAIALDPDSPAAESYAMLNDIFEYYHKDNFNP